MPAIAELKRQLRYNEISRKDVIELHDLSFRSVARKEVHKKVTLQDLIAEGLILWLLSLDATDAANHKASIEVILVKLQGHITSDVITS
jgi:hypothetical protein